jgi:hypothetical protein
MGKLTYNEFENKISQLFSDRYNEPLEKVRNFIKELKKRDDDYIETLYIEAIEDYTDKEHNFEDEYLLNQSVRLLELIY